MYTGLVQHDQIKIEVIKQETIPLLIRCVVEINLHHIKIQQYALQILLALSFKNDTLNILEQDSNFMNYLASLKTSNEENLQRAADRLLWQFDQNANNLFTMPSDSSLSNLKFDIMLSYSHSDKTTCFQIYENLVTDGFHVWIDRDQMHGDTMAAMAHAIENSQFVLICMSEAYKQSPFCQAEAQYAFQRRCQLIPLVMKTRYKPDGWLGIIVSGKIYVDFSKYQFDLAYSILKKEVEKKQITSTVEHENVGKVHQPVVPVPSSSATAVNRHESTVT